MSTVNISLPEHQVSLIDTLISRYGYANRSEFFRSIIRMLIHKPEIVEQSIKFPFMPAPSNQSVKELIADFRKTKKYSQTFLKSLEAGLKRSNYFKP